jgi:phage-related protein
MAAKGITLPIIFKADDKGIKDATGALDGFGKKLGGIAAGIAAAFSIRAVTNFAKESVLVAEAAATAQARLEAVAKATGTFGDNTAQVTDRLGEFAKSQEMRLAVDDKVIKGVQAQLLSFKALGSSADEVGGAFDRATVAAFDMAAAGFGSAEGNATALGKALENPMKGVTALARMGTTFTDQQREQIKVLQESGDMLGAQELILAEVESQYGGVAEATANASDKLALSFENIKENAGTALLPVFAELVEGIQPVLESVGTELANVFTELGPVLTNIVSLLPGLMEAFMPLIPILGVLAGLFLEMVAQLLPVFVELFAQLLPVIAELAPILADVFLQVLQALIPVFMQIIDAVMPIVSALLPVLAELIIALAPVIIKLVEAFLPLIEMVLPILVKLIEFLTPILVFIGELIGTVIVAAVGFFIAAFEKVQKFFEKFGPVIKNIFIGFQIVFATVINAIIAGFEAFINFFIKGFNLIIKGINMVRRELGKSEFALAAEVEFGRLDVPELVPLAVGGIVTRPTAALVGEAGAEAVIPLNKMGSMGNTYNITVNANVADARLGEVVVNAIKRFERTSGPVFASA